MGKFMLIMWAEFLPRFHAIIYFVVDTDLNHYNPSPPPLFSKRKKFFPTQQEYKLAMGKFMLIMWAEFLLGFNAIIYFVVDTDLNIITF